MRCQSQLRQSPSSWTKTTWLNLWLWRADRSGVSRKLGTQQLQLPGHAELTTRCLNPFMTASSAYVVP